MSRLTIYHKPTCSTCREVVAIVEASGRPFSVVNYYEQPLSAAALKALLAKGGLAAADVLRTQDFHARGCDGAGMSEDALIALMAGEPDLLQRPLVETDGAVILARPPDTVRTLLPPPD